MLFTEEAPTSIWLGSPWRCQHSCMSYALWKENQDMTAWGARGLWEAGYFLVALPLSPACTSRREERLKGHLACALGLRDWRGAVEGDTQPLVGMKGHQGKFLRFQKEAIFQEKNYIFLLNITVECNHWSHGLWSQTTLVLQTWSAMEQPKDLGQVAEPLWASVLSSFSYPNHKAKQVSLQQNFLGSLMW